MGNQVLLRYFGGTGNVINIFDRECTWLIAIIAWSKVLIRYAWIMYLASQVHNSCQWLSTDTFSICRNYISWLHSCHFTHSICSIDFCKKPFKKIRFNSWHLNENNMLWLDFFCIRSVQMLNHTAKWNSCKKRSCCLFFVGNKIFCIWYLEYWKPKKCHITNLVDPFKKNLQHFT